MMQVVAEAHVVMLRAGVCASHVGVAPYHHALNAVSVWSKVLQSVQ